MKVKLLKKIRKRYLWYFNSNKVPVLIDKYFKSVIIYDLQHCCFLSNVLQENVSKEVLCELDEWFLRHLKKKLLQHHGWTVNRNLYKTAIYKRNLKLANNG